MSVIIRLKRIGRRNHPTYRIAVADSRKPTDGRTLENLGHYDPVHPVAEFREKVDVERARHWIRNGAKPSHTVRSIFRRANVYAELPKPTKRVRTGRTQDTATAKARIAAKNVRTERKSKRHGERVAAKRAAKKAAAAPAE